MTAGGYSTAMSSRPAPRPRSVVPLPLPSGPEVLDVLPALIDALAGRGPARLPVPADDPATTARLTFALADGPLTAEEDDPDDPTAFVVGTSGSTGPPKGALLSASALHASVAATAERLAPSPGSTLASVPGTWLLAVPPHHVAGMQVLLRSAVAGTVPVVLAPPFRAERFVAATARMPVGPRFVSLVPTQLGRVLDDPDATAALAGFDAVLVGGAATSPMLLDAAWAAGIRTVTTYGMSETCGGCVYDGIPLAGVTVDLLPPDQDGPSDGGAEAEVGLVRLRGPVLARGYRGRPADPAFGADERGRWFRTADLARWTRSGPGSAVRLGVVGRVDDVIMTGGEKVHPVLVETAVAAVPGVRSVVVVGVPDVQWGQAVVAVVVPAAGADGPAGRPADEALVRAVQERARAAGGRVAVPRAVLTIDELPLRGPGKPDRAALTAWAGERRSGWSS